jgi:hypothetical protein
MSHGKSEKRWGRRERERGDRKTDLIRKDHQPPICLSSQYTTDTLSGMTHGIERQIVGFLNPMGVSKELESGLRAFGHDRVTNGKGNLLSSVGE